MRTLRRPTSTGTAILARICNLGRLDRDDIDDLVVEAWLTQAQKRAAKAWLAEQQEQ